VQPVLPSAVKDCRRIGRSPDEARSVTEIATTVKALVPRGASLEEVERLASHCRACTLYQRATQTVFGEGPRGAAVMLVGEQPGDREDLLGRPFVGPAGKLLDKALGEAGITRAETYVTNAVKHFKWAAQGKRRIHEKPTGRERQACYPWLEAEIELVSPTVLVCLGATAAQSLLGSGFRLTQHRGELLRGHSKAMLMATVHPSALLRIEDRSERHEAYRGFVRDLQRAASYARRRRSNA
jgi:uracil-DNA glycosylase